MAYRNLVKYLLVGFLSTGLLASAVFAEEKLPGPETYVPSAEDKPKRPLFDDPTPVALKDILPAVVYNYVTYDKERMAKESKELAGFAAPEEVGKIAPEIKPGKYSYTDLEKYPGLKELIPEKFQLCFKKGEPPFTGNIPEFEIIPTQQFYPCQPHIDATKRNLGKTKLDKEGYLISETWNGGTPFPRPSGEFKAQQVFYNFYLRPGPFCQNFGVPSRSSGFDRNLSPDKYSESDVARVQFKGRELFPPFGWLDKRAERNDEWFAYTYSIYTPRSNRGMIVARMFYANPDKPDSSMLYIPSLRRIRKMTTTDAQDPTGDSTYDDQTIFLQKVTPNKFPYKYEIIEDREYLLPYCVGPTTSYIDSKNNYEMKGQQLMRRPTYVLQLTQLDPNYMYSKRLIYVDKETFECGYAEYYDQKGRLYRHQIYLQYQFDPDGGWIINEGTYVQNIDRIDLHSTLSYSETYPTDWPRKRFSIQALVKSGK